MPIWNGGGSSFSNREPFPGATSTERSRLGQQQPLPVTTRFNVAGDDETVVVADETFVGESGVSCAHDSAELTLNTKPGQQAGDHQLTSDSKKYTMADEATTIVVISEEEAPQPPIVGSPPDGYGGAAVGGSGTVLAASSKSYLQRLGDYLNRRRLRTNSGGEQEVQPKQQQDNGSLSNVIYSSDRSDKDKVMPTRGNFVIRGEESKGKIVSSTPTVQDPSDMSDVEIEEEEVCVDQEDKVIGTSRKVATTTNGYLLPRVFLNKEGTVVANDHNRQHDAGDRQQPPFKLHQNGETISNSVSNSGSERGGTDNKSSGYCSSNLYSSGSIEEPIYSEPIPIVTDIVPRILSGPGLQHGVDDVEGNTSEENEGLVSVLDSTQVKSPTSAMRRIHGSSNSHSSNYSSDKIIITDESEPVDEADDDAEGKRQRRFGQPVLITTDVDDDDEEPYESPLVYRPTESIFTTRLPSALRPESKVFSNTAKRSIPAAPPPPPPPPLPLKALLSTPSKADCLDKIPSQGNEVGLRRASSVSSRKLPTIMEGIDGQIPRPIWPCDMDDSLMDINFESFLYSNEKRESPSTGGGGGGNETSAGQLKPKTSPASGGARPHDIENNYRCMKYLNSCPENPYLVEGVEDLQMSVDKSLALYLKKCDDSLTMQNTRDFLEDIRGKLNVLLENHAQHAQVQLRSKSDSMMYHKSVALIERQIEKLKFDLDSYLRLFNQPNELQIKQLCTGLAKDSRIQTFQNAIENRNNSMRNGSGRSDRGSMVSLMSATAAAATTSTIKSLSPVAGIHDPTIGLENRLPFGNSSATVVVDENDDNELIDDYETMREHHWAQHVNIISQYPENDLSSFFDTVYVQDGFNMGYKVNNSNIRAQIQNDLDGPVDLRNKYGPQILHNRRPVSVVSSSSQRQAQPHSHQTQQKQERSNDNSIASSADPNFRLKRNPSLSLSIASHNYGCDRHPILSSRDYERSSVHEALGNTTTDDSLIGSLDADSLNSQPQRRPKDGHLHQNMLMQQNGALRGAETRLSIDSADRQDLIHDWHKNRPSIWEQYYGVNRPKQSMGKKMSLAPFVVKSGKKKKAAIPYPSSRPESDFTLDVPRAEQLQLKMKKAKQFRNRCRIITSFLSLIFFLLTVMVVSLVLTRGKRMFGSMI